MTGAQIAKFCALDGPQTAILTAAMEDSGCRRARGTEY